MEVKISVIIPHYNRIKFLKEALLSLKSQTYSNFEVIVVDDYSEFQIWKDLQGMISEMNEPRIKIIKNCGQKGACGARNTGLFKAKGEFVVFLDSDDLLAPFCLDQRMEIMKNDSLDFAVFPMLLFYEQGDETKYYGNVGTEEPDLSRFLKLDAVWQTPGPIWKKQFLLDLGGFDVNLSCWQDIDLHIRALLAKPKYNKLNKFSPDSYVRRHKEKSISQNEINSNKKLEDRFYLIQKLEKSVSLKSDVKYICASVLISSLKAKRSGFFLNRYLWALQRPIFNGKEKVILFWLLIAHLSRIDRFRFINERKSLLVNRLVPINQMGKIKYEAKNQYNYPR